jgi:hypothetical protein
VIDVSGENNFPYLRASVGLPDRMIAMTKAVKD